MPSGVLGMVCVWAAAWLASHGDVLGNFYVAPLALRETADFRTVFIEVWSRSRTLDTTPYNSGTPPGSALCETSSSHKQVLQLHFSGGVDCRTLFT